MSKEEEKDDELQDELKDQLDAFGEEESVVKFEGYELGEDAKDTAKKVSEAKRNAKARAGLAKTTDDGSVLDDDKYKGIQMPEEGIHEFENELTCVCICHNRKKKDCAECYDHPIHLQENKAVLEKLQAEDEIIPKKP